MIPRATIETGSTTPEKSIRDKIDEAIAILEYGINEYNHTSVIMNNEIRDAITALVECRCILRHKESFDAHS